MKRFALICFVLLVGLSARAQTNLPSAASLLLDEKNAFDLTAGLTQYQNPPAFSGKLSSFGGEATTILVGRGQLRRTIVTTRADGTISTRTETITGRTS